MTKEASYQIDCACAMNLCQNFGRAGPTGSTRPDITILLGACRACVGRAQRTSTVHELCTAHSARRRKKKGGHTNPDVRTIYIRDCGSNLYVGMRVVEMF